MNKFFTGVVGILLIIGGGSLIINSFINREIQTREDISHRDIEYTIEGKKIILNGEFSYFGNELVTDLNDDDRDDIVFLVTHTPDGGGVFYYVVAALNTVNGYLGSDGYLLGDRIAPQTTEVSRNPRHRNVVVVNYADRNKGEPMTTQPSVGKSAYLKLDPMHMQWGIVVPDFEGESR